MHKSLILHENIIHQNKLDSSMQVHGKEYFNINQFIPEVSGLYELLFSWESQYTNLIERRIFIPIFYFDKNESLWYHSNKVFDIKTSHAIGWCLV